MIIDAHTHIDHLHNTDWTAEMLLAEMKKANIDHSIVIANHNTNATIDDLLPKVAPHKNLTLIGDVYYQKMSQGWTKKLISHLKKGEIKGIKLYPGYEDFYPYDKVLYPLFTYCEENGHPVIVHTGPMLLGCPGYLEQTHPLHIDRIATDFPKLKIVIAHLGNPWFYDTVAVMWKNPNVYTDISALFDEFVSLKETEKEFNRKRLADIRVFMGGFNRFLFGTDWPIYSQKEYVDFAQTLDLTDEEKLLLFEKNAKVVFNLEL